MSTNIYNKSIFTNYYNNDNTNNNNNNTVNETHNNINNAEKEILFKTRKNKKKERSE
jgi:hypothetical protein